MNHSELVGTDRPLEDVERALRGWFTLRVGDSTRVRRSYYDTFDRLLRQEGLTLSAEGDVSKLSARDGCALAPSRSAEDVAGVRALLLIAEVELTEQVLDVLDERQKTVCRIALELPDGLGQRVRLIGLRGYQSELELVSELLCTRGGFEEADAPLVDVVVLTHGGNPAGTVSKVEVELRHNDRADVAAARILLRLLEIMDSNLPGMVADVDTEFLHDYRVAVRRTRAVIRELRGVFPADDLERLRAEFKWLQGATGQTRDLDVYLLEFDELRALVPAHLRADFEEPLLDVLRVWHDRARSQLERDLEDDRVQRLHNEWAGLLAALPGMPTANRPDALRPITELVGRRIRRVHQRMVRMGRAISPASKPEEYHELRKKGKELRYLLELFAVPLFSADVVRPLIKALRGLQDVLGRHQDREVQVTTLKRLGDQVLAQSGDSRALIAMGALVDRLERDAARAREEFQASFQAFASEAQCKLVADTFKPDKS